MLIRQEDLDLIADTKAFTPQPVKIEAPGWLDWLAGVGFVAVLVFLVMAA